MINTREMKEIKRVALLAAEEAGWELLGRYAKFSRKDIKLKSHHEIITEADLASERIIISKIKKNFPDHRILSEEAGDSRNKSDFLWIVDPLDGTTNFSMHNPMWAVSIGVAYQDEMIFGVVFAPFMDELFYAEKGKGTRLNGRKTKVSDIKTGKVLNTYCHGTNDDDLKRAVAYYSRQKMEGFDCRQLGSASIELAYVASGRIESIVIPGAKSWDVAAGALLVMEAGGRVTDFEGNNWSPKSKDIAASNGLVHKKILKILK